MHTAKVIALGCGLLLIATALGYRFGGRLGASSAALIFVPLWLAGAGANMYVGVRRANFTVREELPIFLIVFLVPVAIAMGVWRYFR